ncbi:hypothetical protein BU17DRAFT_87587 [Hysterangium stoloniferum]|nr:hypothetical protein BU17DRAFT_87587 [Hysterangium stoloniferum]
MPDTVIRKITENVWTFSRSGLVPFGGRSTAIKLGTGGVWVLASTPLDDETKAKIDELGDVKYVAAADALHYLFLNDFKKAYPKAKFIGVEALLSNPKCPKFDGAYGADAPGTKYGFEEEIQSCYFSGFENKDVAFHHIPSKSLIEADLLLNLPANEQYAKVASKPWLLRLSLGPTSWLHQKIISNLGKNKEEMKRDARIVAAWDFDRIIPCHGDVIETNGKEAWCALYKDFLHEL